MKEIHKPALAANMVMVTDGNGQPSASTLITQSELNTLNNYDGKGYIFSRLATLETGLVGEIKWYAGTSAPAGYLVCDGSKVSRTTYSKLYAAIGTTWGAGDGSSTFTLPNLIGRVAWGASNGGGYLEAGLPDHKHDIGFSDYQGSAYGEKSISTSHAMAGYGSAGWSANSAYTSNASTSNSIYGKSSTVQPPAAKLIPIIKY